MKSKPHAHVVNDTNPLPEPPRESPTTVALAIFVGGFIGGILRYALDALAENQQINEFPIGTFAANISGSFLIGLFVALMTNRENLPLFIYSGVTVGLLGGYTTFSIFSLQLFQLLENDQIIAALSYATATLGLALFAVWLGQHWGKRTTQSRSH